MAQPPWNKRFFESTRGQLIQILRSGGRTVEELSALLDMSGTSVRAHLAQLQADSVIKRSPRKGAGKPSQVYSLASGSELFFHRAYGPLLTQLIQLLSERFPAKDVEVMMREAGRRLAAGSPAPAGNAAARAHAAAAMINEMGGMVEVAEDGADILLRGFSCPLAAATADNAQACIAMESFLEALIGTRVTECCERGSEPRCRFRVAAAASVAT